MSVVPGQGMEFAHLPGRRSANPLAGIEATSSLRVVELERTEGRKAHRHPHSEEVVYVATGSGSVWIDGETHPVASGDVVVIPTGVAHATVPSEGETMRLICFFPHPDLSGNITDTDIEVT